MRYVTTIERGGIEKGIKQGATQRQRENILGVLQLRFPNVSLPTLIVEQVNSIDDATLLQKVFNLSVLVESMAKFEQELAWLTNA